ncbi:MAG: AbrB/MazE/SpoVT family DNA-binding domain-containing protein, partial [Clostridia bacterium]|nr:AbrB/MazE/SpoVT family DNA-binding domain-containing protein [Clostridia bacterium]
RKEGTENRESATDKKKANPAPDTATRAAEEKGKYFMSGVKIGPKGQIVIPKDVRDMLGIHTGDTLVLLAEKGRGVALQKPDSLVPYLKAIFDKQEENK